MEALAFESREQLFDLILLAARRLMGQPETSTLLSAIPFSFPAAEEMYASLGPHLVEYIRTLGRQHYATDSPRSAANADRIYLDGCFDIMHSGHYNAIRQAKMLGKVLVAGIHSDEEITRNKGPPVMCMKERLAMVRACKWVDEIVENAPYSPDSAWLDRCNCLYLAHGDDIAINSEGVDAYGALKNEGRFKVIKRTEGISTTSIVGKLLLMTREQHETRNAPTPASSVGEENERHFLTTSRRISEFSNKRQPESGARIVYIDGSFDLFHIGHVATLRKARELGDFLIVGIHDDQTVNLHKGANYPIMNLHERVLNVLACKYADEVVIGAPWKVTEDLIKSMNVAVVVQGTIPKYDESLRVLRKGSLDILGEDPYEVAKERGIYVEVESEIPIETKDIIQRIIDNRLNVLKKYTKTSAKEDRYYSDTKVFVLEA